MELFDHAPNREFVTPNDLRALIVAGASGDWRDPPLNPWAVLIVCPLQRRTCVEEGG